MINLLKTIFGKNKPTRDKEVHFIHHVGNGIIVHKNKDGEVLFLTGEDEIETKSLEMTHLAVDKLLCKGTRPLTITPGVLPEEDRWEGQSLRIYRFIQNIFDTIDKFMARSVHF